tara:strand:+ start:4180 stop:4515 length:336 start_codon:yes stop_codon:yes gene_type:complete
MLKELKPPQELSDKPRPQIKLTPVDSSQVARIGYEEESKILAVQFKHGRMAIYHYPNVEPQTYADFMAAESKGVFFREHIKALPFEKFPADPEQSDVQAAAGGTTQAAVEA